MDYGTSSLYDRGDVALRQDVAAAAVRQRHAPPSTILEACREIDTLRSINAHLVRQIEFLKQREAQAQHLADRDGLTGLFNRRKMLELLENAHSQALLRRERIGVLFIDLDGFKEVNDDHGHAAGDKLLVTVARRICGRARTGDLVCRYGGDEFVVILPRVADVASAQQMAEAIQRRIALPCRIDGAEVRVTAAIGMAVSTDDAEGTGELLQRADESMYRQKAEAAAQFPWSHVPVPARRRDDPPQPAGRVTGR